MDDRVETFCERAQAAHGFTVDAHEIEGETAAEIADELGCDPAQVVRARPVFADVLVVALVGGERGVDTRKLATARGVHQARPAPEDAETLGWSADELPPFCHETTVPAYLDAPLTDHETVWASAGAPSTVFPIAPADLVTFADATVVDIGE